MSKDAGAIQSAGRTHHSRSTAHTGSARTAAEQPGEQSAASSEVQDVLCIDVGGSHIKAQVFDRSGKPQADPVRVDTPHPCPPKALLGAVEQLASQLPAFDHVSVGFPGVVRDQTRVLTGVNLDAKAWPGFDLGKAITDATGKPTRVGNDADVQGLAAIKGKGVEVVITLGTGFGTAIFENGRLSTHLEIAHIPFRHGQTYEQILGNPAREADGKHAKHWNKNVLRAIDALHTLTQFDHLYIGGGNAKYLNLDLPKNVTLIPNTYGMAGGVHLWDDQK
jgi:polyphosphate glucokinase